MTDAAAGGRRPRRLVVKTLAITFLTVFVLLVIVFVTVTVSVRDQVLQGQRTLSRRWFVAARREGTSAPPLVNGIVAGTRTEFASFEATAGFRVTRDVTLRSRYDTRRAYGSTDWVNQVGVSAVWANRWW